MSEKLTDETRELLKPGLEPIFGSGKAADMKECAYIRLHGAAERLMMVLQYRSERNYDVAVAAVVRAHADYLRVHSNQ